MSIPEMNFELHHQVTLAVDLSPKFILAAIEYGKQFIGLLQDTGATQSIHLDPERLPAETTKHLIRPVISTMVACETPIFDASRISGAQWRVHSRLQDRHSRGFAVINCLQGEVNLGYDAPILQAVHYLGRMFYRTDDDPLRYHRQKVSARECTPTAAMRGARESVRMLRNYHEELGDALVVE